MLTKPKTIMKAKIYVGTYAKYNAGSINGKWLEVEDYGDIDEFYKACKELHKNEADPEFMFQDYEDIPKLFISESFVDTRLWDYLNTVPEDKQEAFDLWINDIHGSIDNDDDIDSLYDDFQDAYVGFYEGNDPQEDFAEQFVGEHYELEDTLANYFDYEKYARDLFMCDYTEIDGCVFRNV